MNLIKNKSPELWEMYQPVYSTMSVDESWEFYQVLVNEYKDLLEAPPMRAPTKKKTMSKKRFLFNCLLLIKKYKTIVVTN